MSCSTRRRRVTPSGCSSCRLHGRAIWARTRTPRPVWGRWAGSRTIGRSISEPSTCSATRRPPRSCSSPGRIAARSRSLPTRRPSCVRSGARTSASSSTAFWRIRCPVTRLLPTTPPGSSPRSSICLRRWLAAKVLAVYPLCDFLGPIGRL